MTAPKETFVQKWAATATVRATGAWEFTVDRPDGAAVPVVVAGVGPLDVELRARWTPPSTLAADETALAAVASAAELTRAGSLRCRVSEHAVDIVMPACLDGLSRHDFLGAAAEVAKAVSMLDAATRAWEADGPAPSAWAPPEASAAPLAPPPYSYSLGS